MTDDAVDGTAVNRPATALDALAEEYHNAQCDLDPISADFAGLPGYSARLTDYSPAGHAARAALARTVLARAAGLRPADDVDAVTLVSLRERLGHDLDIHDAGLDVMSLNNIQCPVQMVREAFDINATDTVEDWEAIAARLHAVRPAITGYTEGLRVGIARRWSPPRRQVTAATDEARAFAAPDGFFLALAEGAKPASGALPDRLVARLRAGARAAASAYEDLADRLTTMVLPVSRDDDAVGPAVYALAAQEFLGARVDLHDAYAWALDELAAIEDRMGQVASVLAPTATGSAPERIAAAVEVLDADPRRRITGKEEFRTWMQALSDKAVEDLAGTHFDIPGPLRQLRCRIAPSSSGAIYYTAPSEDFTRPGQMWWSVPKETTSFTTWRETSTVYHEGVPGHHLQLGQASYLSGSLNRWRRKGLWVSGHGEGWALYAERLMEELGYLEDPGDLLGMLDSHALRACRVVIDIGVHLRLAAPPEVGGGTWDAAKAWALPLGTHPDAEPTRRFELDRYLGWPGQAISYKIGERVWLGIRAAVAHREGPAFDLKTFHRKALALGSVGLDVLAGALVPERSAKAPPA